MTEPRKTLISAASRHGATAEIAARIATRLQACDVPVELVEPDKVTGVGTYRGVVLGSAIYMGHWLDSAKRLAHDVAGSNPRPHVWLFSSGPVGDPPEPNEDPVDIAELLAATCAVDHRVFAGKIDKAKLGFAERAMLAAVGAAEGDFRNWGEIDAWADTIAASLDSTGDTSTPQPQSGPSTANSSGAPHLLA